MFGIKALDMAAVVVLLSALLKIKAVQANMAQLLNPLVMNMAVLREQQLPVQVCKAGGKGILSKAQLSRWRGTVYPTATAVAAAAPVPESQQTACPHTAQPQWEHAWGVFLPGGKEKDV